MTDEISMNTPASPTPLTSQFRFWVLIVLTFFIPLVGLIAGIIYISKPSPVDKRLGKAVLIFAVVMAVLVLGLMMSVASFA